MTRTLLLLAPALIAEGDLIAVGIGGMVVSAIAGVVHSVYCLTRECRSDDGEGDPPHHR
jgi:hypothetical protein